MIRHFIYDKTWFVHCTNENQIAVALLTVYVLVFLPLYNKKSWWDGIWVELQEQEFELSG